MKTIFFIQAFIETSSRISIIDLFTLKFRVLSRVLPDFISHFSVGRSVSQSVGPSVTKLF